MVFFTLSGPRNPKITAFRKKEAFEKKWTIPKKSSSVYTIVSIFTLYRSTYFLHYRTTFMRILLPFLFCFLFLVPALQSQKLEHRLGYLLIQLEQAAKIDQVLAENSRKANGQLELDRIISKRLGIYLVRFDHARMHQGELLEQLQHSTGIRTAQYDHIPTLRIEPNDPDFMNQWQWYNTGQTGGLAGADIDAIRAWDTATGGVTAAGDTIVVAVIDDGMDYNHEDIAANAWRNYHEIDSNGIDDDGNGYIDDIYGWNAYDNDPDVWGQSHGLQVAGMIGAVGNNGIGVTGMNWNVKIMIIRGGSPESTALASYAYALEQRIQYAETNGEKGAFVVATNSSWGINFGQPADAPLWCAFYDTLGVHGILSAGATANLNIDIDAVGDLPTGCPSEYLLSVTALNHNNQRTFSAYGLTQVDFGAPGEDVRTTRRNNGYGTNSGTSFASPVAAGLVALLYSAPCPGFADLIHTDPSAAALYVRDLIFQGVEPISELDGELAYPGTLNAGNSMDLMMALCSDCPIPFNLAVEVQSDMEATLTWSTLEEPDSINARYKRVSDIEWDTIYNVTQPLLLTDLVGCSEYEIEFESMCADTSTGFVTSLSFLTLGCCDVPFGLNAFADDESISVFWEDVLAAETYIVEWRPENTGDWQELMTPTASILIEDLLACTYYEIRLQSDCDTSASGFSEPILVRTKGCGNCIDLTYCDTGSEDSSDEYIDSLIIGPLANHTGNDGGYALFEDLKPLYRSGQTYDLWIRPGFGFGGPFTERFKVWIDFNQDGAFEEEELILDSLLQSGNTDVSTQFEIPVTAMEGSTRMRVNMAFSSFFNPADQDPCGDIEFGEVEDYCISIAHPPAGCPEVDTVFFDAITFNSAFMYWPKAEGAIAYTYRYREVGTQDYMEMATVDTTASLGELTKCTAYEVQVRTVCTSDTTSYSTDYILETDCDVAVRDLDPLLAVFDVFPNPITDHVAIRFQPLTAGDHHVSLYSLQGQPIQQKRISANVSQHVQVDFDQLDGLPSGLYFVVVRKDGKSATKKIIKL